jgi:hypothetical protein
MLIARVVILPAEDSYGIGDIGPSCGHRVYNACDHCLLYGRTAVFFIGLPLVKLHRHLRENCPGLVHFQIRQHRLNLAVLMDVDRVMLPIAFDVHAEIEGGTPEIIYPGPVLHLVLDLPHQALVSNDQEIIDIQNDCGKDYSVILLVMEHVLSSVDT